MSGHTMGESTRSRLQGIVRSANGNGDGGGGGDGRAAGVYVGGYGGGSGGTWGKAATGRGGMADMMDAAAGGPQVAAGGGAHGQGSAARGAPAQLTAPYAVGGAMAGGTSGADTRQGNPGVRDRARPASAGVKHVWDHTAQVLPKAPPHALTNAKVRPRTATLAKSTRPMAGLEPVEYKLHGTGLLVERPASATNAGRAAGGAVANAAGGGRVGNAVQGASNAGAPTVQFEGLRVSAGPRQGVAASTEFASSGVSEADLAALEDAIRDAVRERRSVYEGSKEMLLRLFKSVDDGNGEVSIPEFQSITSHEAGPTLCVWDSRVGHQAGGSELVRIQFEKEARGITAMAFSPDGTLLVAVATDNYHSLYIYDWRRQRVQGSGRGQMGDPPQVYGIEWCPHGVTAGSPGQFVSFGKKHIKLWTCTTGQWSSKQLSVARLPMQHVHCAAWLSETLVVAGMSDGQLYIFKGNAAIRAIAAHRPGPSGIQPDGHVAYTGLRGMRLCKDNKVLLTGGADGIILQWDVSDGNLLDSRMAGPSIVVKSAYGESERNNSVMVRSLDYNEERGTILVGTQQCDIIEITDAVQEVMSFGHSADIWDVAFHPLLPHICATASDNSRVYIWDTDAKDLLRTATVGFMARAITFSSAPLEGNSHHLAIGGAKGHIRILDCDSLRPVHACKDSKEGVLDLKYSPNNRFMASSTADMWVDVYNVTKGYARISRCSGHSANVRGLDWTTDSSIFHTDAADGELLVWDAKKGKQVPIPNRDTQFATYTVRLGFPVMGIWHPDSMGDDVNAVDRSKGGDLLVTSDDDGMVKLFNYPCVVHDAPHRAYRGHSSFVQCVRFNSNDTQVCSVGSADWSMFQFRVVQLEPEPPPPLEKVAVWGALDASGRSFGYTKNPVPTGAAASVPPSPSLSQPQPSQPLPPVLEEDGVAAAVSSWDRHGVGAQEGEGQGPNAGAVPSRFQHASPHLAGSAASVRYADHQADDQGEPLDESFNAPGGGYADDLALDEEVEDEF
ncbi:MAG: hypothetical protein WDW38_003227 [Sanguina aurantia]